MVPASHLVAIGSLISAGYVAPDDQKSYIVAHCGKHPTLVVGDVVVMRETPKFENVLVRLHDLSLHSLHVSADDPGYVVLSPCEQ